MDKDQIIQDILRMSRMEGLEIRQAIKKYCEDNNTSVDYDIYIEIINKSEGRHSNSEKTPEVFSCLINSFIEQSKYNNALNPFVRNGEVANVMHKNKIPFETVAIMKQDEFVGSLFGAKSLVIDSVSEDQKYDLIAADLPFLPLQKLGFVDNILDASACMLSKEGICIFTFPSGITFNRAYLKKIEELENKGLFINAIINMPVGAYLPYSGISAKIVIFSNNKTSDRFYAQIIKMDEVDTIVKNYILGKNAKKADAGIWLNPSEYRDYDQYSSYLESLKLEKAYQGKLTDFGSVIKEINLAKNDKFPENENAIYIPKVGTAQIVISENEFTGKPQNYFQVVIDTDTVSLSYLLFFFNSPRGIQYRKDFQHGTTIRSFNKEDIVNLPIVIPGREEQEEIAKTELAILEIESTLEVLKQRLYATPASFKSVRKDIKKINNEDTLEKWIETIPYPVASILRKYITDDTDAKRQETLFFFFEAFALFQSCILISIVNNNKDLLQNNNIFAETEPKYYERASFGNWVKLNRIISKQFVKMLSSNNEDEKNLVYSCFGTKSNNIINTLCSKDICNILDTTSKYRNDWKGHTGISSESTYTDHVTILYKELQKLIRVVGTLFDEYTLVRSYEMKYAKGVFANKIELLMGSNALFKKDIIELSQPLDNDYLYLVSKETGKAIELTPLIVFRNSPPEQKNACYFYSKVDNGNTKYVSYHYEGKPEDTEEGNAAFSVISELINNY